MKIFCLLGKSSSGKDTIYKQLLQEFNTIIFPLVTYTTRPMREGEVNGKEYFFINEDNYWELLTHGKIIEERHYNTVAGLWRYMTVNDSQFEGDRNLLVITTLEGLSRYIPYFGLETVIPLYIDLDDGERLQRALDREKKQVNPKYAELCRRYLADAKDFSEDKLSSYDLNIFVNNQLSQCVDNIISFIKEELKH